MFEMTVESQVPNFVAQLGRIQAALTTALEAEVNEIEKLYKKTDRTWDQQVKFNKKVRVDSKEISGTVWAEDRIYYFVHESVKNFRAILSPNYVARTKVGVLDSFSGQGHRLYASKRIDIKPPYKARKFTQAIIVKRKPKFKSRMEAAMLRGAKSYVGL